MGKTGLFFCFYSMRKKSIAAARDRGPPLGGDGPTQKKVGEGEERTKTPAPLTILIKC